jgi:hypothetical protein
LSTACAKNHVTGFSPDTFLDHVRFLADDELAGRGLGSDGLDLAAHYIGQQFVSAGVEPGGVGDSYFQTFQVTVRRELTDKTHLAVGGEELVAGADFAVTPFSSAGTIEGPVAFVGYGVSAPEHHYDDYAQFDAKGKVVLMLRYEPHDEDEEATFGGKEHSEHAYFMSKVTLAKKNGAVAVLLVNPPRHHAEADKLLSFEDRPVESGYGLPFIHISRTTANRLLAAGGLDDLTTLQTRLDTERKSLSADLTGVSAKGDTGLTTIKSQARNVIGLIRGGGDKADEYVVIGAHFDHLGHSRSQFKPGDKTEHIHNGADDNASGTAGLIELSKRFASRRESLRRSVLLIAFTGEERGLLGSSHYVDHATVPADKIVAMLNMDMIGRLRDDELQIFGVKTAPEFTPLLDEIAETMGLTLKTTGSGTGPSDHTSFYNLKIPVLHFFTGTHKDYHRPTDDTELVNAQGGARVTEMVYRVADRLIEREDRLTFQATKGGHGGRPQSKVRLGLMPAYTEDDIKGMPIDGVAPESPAELAGLKRGDRIVRLADTPVDNVYDLMEAMSDLEPDKTVAVEVVRDGKNVTLSITPEGRP